MVQFEIPLNFLDYIGQKLEKKYLSMVSETYQMTSVNALDKQFLAHQFYSN